MNTAAYLFYENGYNNVSVSDICKATGIANGNLNYYFKRKRDIAKDILEIILNQCVTETETITGQNKFGLDFAYCGAYMFMIIICMDKHFGHFFLDIYNSISTRDIVVFFTETMYYHFFPTFEKETSVSEEQKYYLIVADVHAKLGILHDLLERTNFHPSVEEIQIMAETAFLITCKLCSVPDSYSSDAIDSIHKKIENYDYKCFLDKVKELLFNQTYNS